MVATGYDASLVAAFLALLVVAVAVDVARRRIPNPLSIVLALGGLAAQLYARGWPGVLAGGVAGAIIFGLLFVPWLRGGIGGGDLKLAAAAAVWLGWSKLVAFVLIGSIVGGTVAVVCYLLSAPEARQTMRSNVFLAAIFRAWPEVAAPTAGRVSVPYAIAVAVGAACALFLPGGVQWIR